MTTAQQHQPYAVRERLADQVPDERSRLPVLPGGLFRIVGGVDHDAEQRAGVGRAEHRDSLTKAVNERSDVFDGFCRGRGDERVAEALGGKFVGDLDERVAVAMARVGCATIEAMAKQS